MKVCHVCKAECDDAAELCPVCGADLTAEITEEEEKEEKIIMRDFKDLKIAVAGTGTDGTEN